ncbi:polysaccharide ABC transporter ATP-binding protein [bacterium]|nr:polysaccharide ABC transporter ATP-binding protein [bacterium]
MSSDVVVRVDNVSKKFCKSVKKSMVYATFDITRNLLGISTRSGKLRSHEFWAVDGVSFELRQGESIGLVGPNGSGKTTTLQMINGIFWPDKGEITVQGRIGALIAVGAGFHPMLSGRENIYVNAAILGMTKSQVDKQLDSIIDFADIGDFLDTPVKYYSSGMFVRLGFAVAAHCNPDILLVDEVLAVGDARFQRKCLNHLMELKKSGTSFILVSHNMQSVEGVADKGIAFNKGQVVYEGDVTEAIAKYELLMLQDSVSDDVWSASSSDPDSLQLVKRYAGYGTDEVAVESIKLFDENGVPCKRFDSDSPMVLSATIRSSVKDDMRLLVNLINERDIRCLGLAQQVSVSEGIHELNFKLDPLQISTGRYKVQFVLFDSLYTNPFTQGHYGYFDVEKRCPVRTPGENSPLCWVAPKINVVDLS